MEYHIELLMQTTTLKSLEVSPPFFFLYLKAYIKIKILLVVMTGSVKVKETHGKFQMRRIIPT